MPIIPRPALAAALTVSFLLCVHAGPTVMSLAAEKEKATLLPAALHTLLPALHVSNEKFPTFEASNTLLLAE
jgi:hypothetical protein